MAYRPRFSISVPVKQMRFPMAWTPMALHEARDGKRVSGQATTKVLYGAMEGRKYLKRTQKTWHAIRVLYHDKF